MRTEEKLYGISGKINNNIKNIGYAYEGKVIKNSISGYLLKNRNIAGFIEMLEPMITEVIALPKKLKAFWNFTIPKNYRDFN